MIFIYALVNGKITINWLVLCNLWLGE